MPESIILKVQAYFTLKQHEDVDFNKAADLVRKALTESTYDFKYGPFVLCTLGPGTQRLISCKRGPQGPLAVFRSFDPVKFSSNVVLINRSTRSDADALFAECVSGLDLSVRLYEQV